MWCGHKSGKRAVLLAVILSLGLTACGSREKEKESRLPGTVYVPKFTELKLAAEGLRRQLSQQYRLLRPLPDHKLD